MRSNKVPYFVTLFKISIRFKNYKKTLIRGSKIIDEIQISYLTSKNSKSFFLLKVFLSFLAKFFVKTILTSSDMAVKNFKFCPDV